MVDALVTVGEFLLGATVGWCVSRLLAMRKCTQDELDAEYADGFYAGYRQRQQDEKEQVRQ